MQAIRNAAARMPGMQNCWQRNWPRVFLLFSLATAALCFASIITGLITAILQPRLVLLSIYCLIFALLGFSAELRQFSWCRRVVYLWMRYFYFLTYYKARAIFYLMFGCLLLTSRVLDIIAAIVTIVLGFMMLLTSLIVDLPVFEDPREQQEKEEEFRNYYSGPEPSSNAHNAPPAAPPAVSGQAGGASNFASDAPMADTPAQPAKSAAVQNTQMTAKAPPSAMPAQTYATPQAANYTEQAYRNSSDDEPARTQSSGVYGGGAGAGGANMYASGGKSGPSMFAPSDTSRATSMAPPLQEAGVTRGTGTESAIRRDFAAAVATNLKDDDLR